MKTIYICIIALYFMHNVKLLAYNSENSQDYSTYTVIQYFGAHKTHYKSLISYKDVPDLPVDVLYDSYNINGGVEILKNYKYIDFGGGFGISTGKLIDSGSPLDILLNKITNDKSIFPIFNLYFSAKKDFKIKSQDFFIKIRAGITNSFQATRYKSNDLSVNIPANSIGGGSINLCIIPGAGVNACSGGGLEVPLPPINLPSFPNEDINDTINIETDETIKIKGKSYLSLNAGYLFKSWEFGLYYNINYFNIELQQLNFIETPIVDIPFLSTLQGNAKSSEFGFFIAYRFDFKILN